jgi:dTDP-4-amino-4,6-dideoxygalactose transaminase
LDGWTEARQRNAAHYSAAFAAAELGNNLTTPQAAVRGRHIFNQYIVRVKNRDALKDHLTARSIGTEIYYPVPLHLQKCFSYLQHAPGDFPESERAAAETLALPIYPELTQAQLDHVIASVAYFYRSATVRRAAS